MIFCTNCGSQVAEGLKFCAECGTTVEVKGGTGTPGGNQIEAILSFFKSVPKYKQALALAVLSSVLVVVFLLSGVISSSGDMGAMGGGELSQNTSVFYAASSFRLIVNVRNDAIQEEVDNFIDRSRERPTRSEINDFRRDMEDLYDRNLPVDTIRTAARSFRFMSTFVVISIFAILVFLYLLIIGHPKAKLVGFAGTGLAALTSLIILIGTSRVRSAIADDIFWRDLMSVSTSFWIWPAIIVAAVAIWFVYSLKDEKTAKTE